MYVEAVLCLDPLQHGVQRDEGACPAHTSAAVHQQQVLHIVGVTLPHSLDEVDHGDGIGGHSMVRPRQVVEQRHLKWGTLRLIRLHKIIQCFKWAKKQMNFYMCCLHFPDNKLSKREKRLEFDGEGASWSRHKVLLTILRPILLTLFLQWQMCLP